VTRRVKISLKNRTTISIFVKVVYSCYSKTSFRNTISFNKIIINDVFLVPVSIILIREFL
jgi:hypothetical protein